MAKTIELVTGGQPRFCLQICPPQDAEAIIEAIDELVTHLEACLEQPVVWWDRWARELPPLRVVLNYQPEAPLARDGFRFEVEPAAVVLTAATPTGLRHAVAELLEEAFGVRWLWPGALGTVIPRATEVRLPLGRRDAAPAWAWRRLWTGGAFWREDDAALAEQKVAGVSPDTMASLRAWQRRRRLEGLTIADGHRWAQICPPEAYGASHPEYFALIGGRRDTVYFDGKHQNQPCTSNPAVVALTASHLVAQFRARPELDGFSLAVNDGLGFCECDACRRLDEAIAAEADSALDATTDEVAATGPRKVITDRMLRFANAVAEAVARDFPDKLLLFLIYSVYREPPVATRLHPNVIAQFCIRTWANADTALFDRELATMGRLARDADRLGIYDYYVNGRNGTLPRGFARVAHRSLQAYHARGYRYFATQAGLDFATNGFVYYLTARLLWANDLDFDALLDDWCQRGFGPGAPAVRRYLLAFVERWDEEGPGPTENPVDLALYLYPESWLAARRQDLEEAQIGTAGVERRRVGFLLKGLDFLEHFVAASHRIRVLIDAGAPGKPQAGQTREAWLDEVESWARTQPRRRSRAAVAARLRLLRWVDRHADGCWISAMWFHYSRLQREPWLGAWMDRIEAGCR